MGDHKYFIVIIIFYISKNNNYKLLCKSDLTVTYCLAVAHAILDWFSIKIVANKAYLQGLHRSSSNRAKLVETSSVSSVFFSVFFFMEWLNCNWESGPVRFLVFFWSYGPDFLTLDRIELGLGNEDTQRVLSLALEKGFQVEHKWLG